MKGSFYSALALALATFLPFPHVHAGTVIESGGLMGVTVPTDVDIAQCQNRRVFKADGFVLGDSPFGEGCVLNDTERFLTYNLDRTEATNFTSPLVAWTLEVKRPARNDLVVGIVSPRKRPLFYCFARGQLGRATVPEFLQNGLPAEGSQSETPPNSRPLKRRTNFTGVLSNSVVVRTILQLLPPLRRIVSTMEGLMNWEMGMSSLSWILRSLRSMDLPSRFNSKIDKGIMQYILNVKNVPFSPYDSESLPFYPNYQFSQQVLIIWLDGKDQSLGTTNTTIFDAFNGIEWTEEVPAGARKAALTFFTDYPYYSVVPNLHDGLPTSPRIQRRRQENL
ncbi:hypothetical protein BC829DRAFT_182105 [Chytridium lagenaria]|nr:hypothetical protein BC829DRAFT_182105 [Chytridium lagenaria]